MSRFHSYLNSANEIITAYSGDEPFSSFLKKYFSLHKKFGSNDRKRISHLCYCYFRLGKSLQQIDRKEKIVIGLFLCSTGPNEILHALKPEWNEIASGAIRQKLSILNYPFLIQDIFPWKEELSNEIDSEKFSESFFTQPDLFLRLRPGKEELVKHKLAKAAISFSVLSDNCISLSNSSKIDEIIELDKEAVIQDYNSQQTGELVYNHKLSLWDCCAGSGGKSIMVYDLYPGIELTVSDIRESILSNLKKRFQKAGIKNYSAYTIDLSKQNDELAKFDKQFPVILADVPCSGSGTWGRTPEQLCFFEKEKIDHYSVLQKKIVSNVIPHLEAGGYFIYITCSVFKKENEEPVQFIETNFHLDLIEKKILKGYDKKADTMFIAIFKKNL